MRKLFFKEIGVDMGSAYTRIGTKERGIVLCEPTVVAVQLESGRPAAIGREALELIRYAPEQYKSVYPVKNGLITDCSLASQMMKGFLRKAFAGKGGLMHSMAGTFSVPCELSDQDYAAWEYCATMSGIRKVRFVEEPLAAALSEGWDVYRPYGRMAVSLGAGDIRAAVMTFSGIAACGRREAGGAYLDGLIAKYISDTYGLQVSSLTAERIKLALGAQGCGEAEMHILGKPQEQNGAREVLLHPAEVAGVLQMMYEEILAVILQLFSEISPELLSDIAQEGILLYGGNALLYGLQAYLQEKTELPVRIAENPLQAVAKGACIAGYCDTHPLQSWMA